jgi:hypothetical protein
MPSPVGAPINPEEASVLLTSPLIYQEKVIAAEGMFGFLLFEFFQKKTMLKHEHVIVGNLYPASVD